MRSMERRSRVQSRVLTAPASPHSDVRVYDPSGDSTLPSVSKKRKFEELEEEEEPAASKPAETKAKKPKKEAAAEGEILKPDPPHPRSFTEFKVSHRVLKHVTTRAQTRGLKMQAWRAAVSISL